MRTQARLKMIKVSERVLLLVRRESGGSGSSMVATSAASAQVA